MLKHLFIELRQNARRLLLNFRQCHQFKIDCTSLDGVGLGTNGYKCNCPIIATYLLKKKTTKLLATTKRISPLKHMSMTISVCLCQGWDSSTSLTEVFGITVALLRFVLGWLLATAEFWWAEVVLAWLDERLTWVTEEFGSEITWLSSTKIYGKYAYFKSISGTTK